ncbi:CotH kinase family protein, partial [Verrucomicrobia bacterium]|nr:CotH kinase family protein [Verrucomicrobiota bacterium]
MRNIRKRHYAVTGLATILGIAGCVAPLSRGVQAGESRRIRDALFEGSQVLQIDIEIPNAEIETLRGYRWQWNRQDASPRPKVRAVIREGNRVYHNVALHLKGAAGSFRSIDDRPGMTLNFDRFEPGQKFHGLDKLSLNNSVQDPTLCNEWLARQLFLEAGVPVPRATHARVRLNGRELGLYVLMEGFNRRFLRGHFDDDSGNLYDGGFVQDVDGALNVSSGKIPDDRQALKRLNEAIEVSDLVEREERLGEILDLDRFLSHLATDVMLFNWDGYHLNRNNYRIFNDRSQGKLVFMPHGLDQLFENPDGPIFPMYQGKVSRAVMEIPRMQQAYFERIGDLVNDLFDVERLHDRIDRTAEVIRRDLALNDPAEIPDYLEEVSELKERVARRYETLRRELDGPAKVPKFDSNGLVSLKTWNQDQFFGKPKIESVEHEGTRSLMLSTEAGTSVGRWKTSVWLEAGDYELVGRMKLSGIEAGRGDPRGGVAMWSSVRRIRERQTGSEDWTERQVRFSVRQPIQEV